MADQSGLGRKVFVFEVRVGAVTRELVSILDPSIAFVHGLPTQAVLGELLPGATGDHRPTPERFRENPAFVRYLQGLISTRIHEVEGIRQVAQEKVEGYIYLIDARTPQPGGDVPTEDIIGAVRVQAGIPVAGSYEPNPNHRLLTKDGFFKLPGELESILQTDLETRFTRPT